MHRLRMLCRRSPSIPHRSLHRQQTGNQSSRNALAHPHHQLRRLLTHGGLLCLGGKRVHRIAQHASRAHDRTLWRILHLICLCLRKHHHPQSWFLFHRDRLHISHHHRQHHLLHPRLCCRQFPFSCLKTHPGPALFLFQNIQEFTHMNSAISQIAATAKRSVVYIEHLHLPQTMQQGIHPRWRNKTFGIV